jgi:hypothetical protein
MSLLSVAQDVTDMIGFTRPSAIVSSTDALARQILSLAKETLEELGRMDWPALEIPYTFNTVVDQSQYALPADFGREVGDSVYVSGQYQSLRGSLTAADWQRQKSGMQANLGRYRFRIFGLPTMLNITPVPSKVETLVMEYQTTYRVQQTDSTYKNTFFADTDVSLMPEELLKKGLKWRLRHAKGLDYSEEFNDYEMSRAARLAQAMSMGSMPVAFRSGLDNAEGIGNMYMPEGGYGS